ncbi:centromere protein O [Lampris incognitus]|uniref:centromere protein O n=1 Tax=Lampris incognitus TaxID=2546036 RepID=UPI0024B614B6|nr:centromere protein O [Lampris incognitus]
MEGQSAKGVLSHLSDLEALEKQRRNRRKPRGRVDELRAAIQTLVTQRNRLQAEMEANSFLQKLQMSMGEEDDDDDDNDSVNSQLSMLMKRRTQLKDLLRAHYLIGGKNIVKTHHGKGVSISLATTYEGLYLDTYNLDIDLTARLKITRHNLPPFIPLDRLIEQSNMQTDIMAFLDTLSQYLNAFVGRRQQLKLVKELHKSTEVLESNMMCSILVLLLTATNQNKAVLCKMTYADHTRCLPTKVSFESEDSDLSDSHHWEEISTLLKETPLHKALTIMRERRIIV